MATKRRRAGKKPARSRLNTDRVITIVVSAFLVLVIGGAVALQLAANQVPPPTPSATTSSSAPVPGGSTDSIQRISASEAKAMVDAGTGVLIDVRLAESYASEHASGAIMYAEDQKEALLGTLPTGKSLIMY